MQEKQRLQEQRRVLFRSVGERLLADLRAAVEGETDTEVQGRAGDAAFRKWLQDQIPNRFRVVTGTVLSPQTAPTTERDCLVFDGDQSPTFRQIGGRPDMFPIEGVVASVEINTGHSGASYAKLLHDAKKLSDIGKLQRGPPLPKPARLSPLVADGGATIPGELWVSTQQFPLQPLLLIFAESLRGNLPELCTRVAAHNRTVSIRESVDGVFILNQGFVLHLAPGQGWNVQRLAGFPLGWMEVEPWEVLLKLMSIIWNYLWKGPCEFGPDLGSYYADQAYFLEVEQPRLKILDDTDYLSQTEAGFVTFRP